MAPLTDGSAPETRRSPGLSSIRGRIVLSFVVLMVGLTVLLGGTVWLTGEYRDATGKMQDHAAHTDLLNEVARFGLRGAVLTQLYVSTGDENLLVPAQANLDLTQATLQQTASRIRADGRADEADRVDQLVGTSLDFRTQWNDAAALRRAGDVAGANAAMIASLSTLQTLVEELAALTTWHQEALSEASADAHTLANVAMYATIVFGSLLIIGAALAFRLATRSILSPLRKLETAAEALAEGDLRARAPVTGLSEVAAVGRGFNRMTEKLLDASRRRELEEEREHAYAALTESEEKWRSLVDNTSDIVTILDAQGTIRLTSSSVTEVLGYSADELAGEDAFALVHPDDRPAVTHLFTDLIGTDADSFQTEFRYRQKDGHYRALSAVASALTDENGRTTGAVVVSRDVTERREMMKRLEFQAHLLAAVGDAVVATGLDGRVLYWNEAAKRTYGWTAEEAVGRPIQELLRTPEGEGGPMDAIARVAAGDSFTAEFVTQTKSGDWIPVEVMMSPLRDADGRIIGAIGDSHDISHRKTAEETIRHMAYHDALTGLPNRLLLRDRFEIAVAQARRARGIVGVLSLDLDRFKIINDTLGHSAGDKLLVEATQRLLTTVREEDTVSRLGGDEFIILLGGLASKAEALEAASRIVDEFRLPFSIAGTSVHTTVSIGVAFYSDDGADLEAITASADMAMYAAKEAGRDGFHVFTPELSSHGAERLDTEAGLRQALNNDEIEVFYQPQVSVESGVIIGVEALARWRHPSRGIIEPAEFIPIAEETGIIVPLGRRVLARACADAVAWEKAGAPPMRLAVNASLREFTQGDFVTAVARIVTDAGFPADRLQIEITETEALRDVDVTRTIAEELGELGIAVAIDDFGAGNTSLRHLSDLPVRTLKIDRALIQHSAEKPSDTAIMASVINLAHKLSLEVVAEGVETPEQLRLLGRKRCDAFQGFLHSRPASAEDTQKLLTSAAPSSVR